MTDEQRPAPAKNVCARCERPITKEEGGQIFTVCEVCWKELEEEGDEDAWQA